MIKDPNMKNVCAKMVPKNFGSEQKGRKEISPDASARLSEESDLFEKVVTGDETWVFQQDPQTEHQNLQW
jgi:hypothetical protein